MCSSSIGPIVVIEGMPGAGKTTAIERLAQLGHQTVPEYMEGGENPDVGDDAAHQGNWLRKAQITAALAVRGPVHCDRDLLTSLSFAASITSTDGGALLRQRSDWVVRHVKGGYLAIADAYVILDVAAEASLSRRADRLTPGHPWGCPRMLAHLRDFYRDPVASLRAVDNRLAQLFEMSCWWHASGEADGEEILRVIDAARVEVRCGDSRCSSTTVGMVAAPALG